VAEVAKCAANLGSQFGMKRELKVSMMLANQLSETSYSNSNELLFSILENTELGVFVVENGGRVVYMNASARHILQAPHGFLPDWATVELKQMIDRLSKGGQVVERWSHDDLVMRVRARPLAKFSALTVLEVSITAAKSAHQISETLSRSLELSYGDARLLGLLWRGMSNDEIATTLNVRVGTVKSRLFRLYQKLGVRRRPAAVLRAAEVLRD